MFDWEDYKEWVLKPGLMFGGLMGIVVVGLSVVFLLPGGGNLIAKGVWTVATIGFFQAVMMAALDLEH